MTGTISATISHKFEVSDFEKAGVGEELKSPDVDVVHNNVTLKFNVTLRPNNVADDDKGHVGLFVNYRDGPQTKIELEYHFFVINGKKRISLKADADKDEFMICAGWGFHCALPRPLKDLKDGGYLSSRGKILHVTADLSIPDSAFVRPPQIFASLSHRFDVQKFPDAAQAERIDGSVVSVAHNNVKLQFKLFAIPNDVNNHLGLYVQYFEGPNSNVVMDIDIIVVKGRKRSSIRFIRHVDFEKGRGKGCRSLPRTIEELRASGYLSWDNKLIVIAELSVPKSAFAIPEQKSTFVQVDTFGFDRHQELDSPADITSPASNRVQLVSKDGSLHLWAHKDILSSSSEVFKDLFDPNRPETAKLDCFKQGVLEFVDLSGEALKHMMHFVYLRQPGKEFEKSALEIVPVADQFLIKGLKEVCQRSLIEGMDVMVCVVDTETKSMDSLCRCLESSYTFSLPALTAACTETLPMYIQHDESDDIDQKHLESLLNLSQQHALAPLKSACETKLANIMDNTHDRAQFLSLLSLARQHQMDVLVTHCVRSFKNKFDVLNADGFVRALMDDNSENGRDVLQFLIQSMATLPLP